jgi:hypothetical protein
MLTKITETDNRSSSTIVAYGASSTHEVTSANGADILMSSSATTQKTWTVNGEGTAIYTSLTSPIVHWFPRGTVITSGTVTGMLVTELGG